MTPREIRSRLLNGETINTICREYNITFADLVKIMSRYGSEESTKNKQRKGTGHLYISEHCGKYIIRKNRKHFGTYKSLRDAIRIRDWFICNGWYVHRIDRACRECKVERCTR